MKIIRTDSDGRIDIILNGIHEVLKVSDRNIKEEV